MGTWAWRGTRKTFVRFPKSTKKHIASGNSAANTQLFIELLDAVGTIDAMAIKSYLLGGVGFTEFRKFVTKCLRDHRITSVIWADSPSCINKLGPEDRVATAKMCHSVRSQMLKMLRVGAIEWTGFVPPVRPDDIMGPQRKKSKCTDSISLTITSQPKPINISLTKTNTQTTRPPLPQPPPHPQPPPLPQPPPPLPQPVVPIHQPPLAQTNIHHKHTQTTNTIFTPLLGTYSLGDRIKDDCIRGISRLRQVTPRGFHWTSPMITLVLLLFTMRS